MSSLALTQAVYGPKALTASQAEKKAEAKAQALRAANEKRRADQDRINRQTLAMMSVKVAAQ